MSYLTSVLFVCLGNICRSPAGEAMLYERVQADAELKDSVRVASCGVGDWYMGDTPDERMRHHSQARGLVLAGRAQNFHTRFFNEFTLILPVDHHVQFTLYERAATPHDKSKIRLATEFSASYPKEDIPDPFFEGDAVFEQVLDMLEDVCDGVIQYLKKKERPQR